MRPAIVDEDAEGIKMACETMLVSTIEGILSPSELDDIISRIEGTLSHRREEFTVAARSRSVHGIDGHGVERAKEVYEPSGRIEFDELPVDIAELMEEAVRRRLPDIRRVYPHVRRSMDWFYVEYDLGQFVTPHVDYPFNAMNPDQPKIAAISVTLKAAIAGGEFFVDTSSDATIWTPEGTVRRGADEHSDWFRAMRRTRWRVKAAPGDAICWGTELVHGTEPVNAGSARKLIAFLAA